MHYGRLFPFCSFNMQFFLPCCTSFHWQCFYIYHSKYFFLWSSVSQHLLVHFYIYSLGDILYFVFGSYIMEKSVSFVLPSTFAAILFTQLTFVASRCDMLFICIALCFGQHLELFSLYRGSTVNVRSDMPVVYGFRIFCYIWDFFNLVRLNSVESFISSKEVKDVRSCFCRHKSSCVDMFYNGRVMRILHACCQCEFRIYSRMNNFANESSNFHS